MQFNSKDFNAEKIRAISYFSATLKNTKLKNLSDQDELFACYFVIFKEIVEEALLGNYNLKRTYSFSVRQELRVLGKLRKEFRSLGFQFDLSVQRKQKTFTYEIIWLKN
jgi:hypothetical protein